MIGNQNEINVYVNDFNWYTTRNDNRHTGNMYKTMRNIKFTCTNVTVMLYIKKKKTNSKHPKIFLAMNISFCENVLFVYKILNMYMCVDFCGFYQPV